MLIKAADDQSGELEFLKNLARRAEPDRAKSRAIEQEIRNIQSGIKGEAEAAYEIGFHFGASKNWMILHDLRLECEGRVSQIDHLLINRFLEIYVCESKRFAEGISINEHGEFSAFYADKPYGVPSPIEQNRRHIDVLKSVFKTGLVDPPRRLGITMTPSLHGLVLVSRNAHIRRPKAKVDGLDTVIKNDQIKARIWKDIDESNNPLLIARLIGQDTLEQFARRLAAAHRPISFDWHTRFGVSPAVATITTAMSIAASAHVDSTDAATSLSTVPDESQQTNGRKSKLICVSCGVPISYAVAKFCWTNKRRFEGQAYCMGCQKNIARPNN